MALGIAGMRIVVKKSLVLGLAALVTALGFAAPAGAADFPASPRPMTFVPAYYDWSGLYAGLNGGGGYAHKCWDINSYQGAIIPSMREGCHNATGGFIGGQMGYRLQWSSVVVGIEAQGDWSNMAGSNASLYPFPTAATDKTRVNGFGLFTGQAGIAFNNVLVYGKGGAAIAADRYNGVFTSNGVTFDQATESRWGGTIGAGLEWSFAQDWSVAVEYDHLFFGARNITMTSTLIGTTPPQSGALSRYEYIHQDMDIGSVRVNYRWGGPVISKY